MGIKIKQIDGLQQALDNAGGGGGEANNSKTYSYKYSTDFLNLTSGEVSFQNNSIRFHESDLDNKLVPAVFKKDVEKSSHLIIKNKSTSGVLIIQAVSSYESYQSAISFSFSHRFSQSEYDSFMNSLQNDHIIDISVIVDPSAPLFVKRDLINGGFDGLPNRTYAVFDSVNNMYHNANAYFETDNAGTKIHFITQNGYQINIIKSGLTSSVVNGENVTEHSFWSFPDISNGDELYPSDFILGGSDLSEDNIDKPSLYINGLFHENWSYTLDRSGTGLFKIKVITDYVIDATDEIIIRVRAAYGNRTF